MTPRFLRPQDSKLSRPNWQLTWKDWNLNFVDSSVLDNITDSRESALTDRTMTDRIAPKTEEYKKRQKRKIERVCVVCVRER